MNCAPPLFISKLHKIKMSSISSGRTLCYCPCCSYYSLKLPVQSTRSHPSSCFSFRSQCFFDLLCSPVSCTYLLNVEPSHLISSTRLHPVFYVFIFIILHLFRKLRPFCLATGSLDFSPYHTENTFSPHSSARSFM